MYKSVLRQPLWLVAFLLLGALLFLIVSYCGSDNSPENNRVVDIGFASASNSDLPICSPTEIEVQSGEVIRFRVTNNTPQQIEFIVVSDAGLQLRKGITEVNYSKRPDPEGSNQNIVQTIPPTNTLHSISALRSISTSPSISTLRSISLQNEPPNTLQQIHEGHADESGSDATANYRYRILVDPMRNDIPGVKTMLVTFPEPGEAEPFSSFVCAQPTSLNLYVGTFIIS